MSPNAFLGRPDPPTPADLDQALGPAKPLWDELLERLAADCNLVTQEWNSYSRKAGWALRLKEKKRNILYLSPNAGSFGVSLVLGDKAVEAVRQSKLPRKIIALVEEGKRYPEGTAVRLDVMSSKDIPTVAKLVAIKMAN